MANPISRRFVPANRIDDDPISEAQRQDRERRIREDNEYFERTGINPRPRRETDPLVPINGREPEDIAEDGDEYIDEGLDMSDLLTPSPNLAKTISDNNERREYERREQVIKEKELKKKVDEFESRPKNTILDIDL